MNAKLMTANDLQTGIVLWLTADGNWSKHIADAEIFTDPELAQQKLAWAEESQEKWIVGPYLMDVETQSHIPGARSRLREEIRRDGPSIPYGMQLSDHGVVA